MNVNLTKMILFVYKFTFTAWMRIIDVWLGHLSKSDIRNLIAVRYSEGIAADSSL